MQRKLLVPYRDTRNWNTQRKKKKKKKKKRKYSSPRGRNTVSLRYSAASGRSGLPPARAQSVQGVERSETDSRARHQSIPSSSSPPPSHTRTPVKLKREATEFKATSRALLPLRCRRSFCRRASQDASAKHARC